MQEQSIFIEALERDEPVERELYLNQVCAGDPLLRQRIDRLLKRHRETDGFLEAPVFLPASRGPETSLEGPGTLIGPYKLLEQIGEGGFGLVFLAEQQHPVRRKVALKVLKPGMDSKQVIARFEAERQALALMDHPNIARVLEAGETPSGRPHFVMELVRGEPITEYCDQNGLATEQRLELFASVCAAVQHAHQKGIIHRDIKPSNVLVTLHDDKPVVKVIDFGIAKAIGQSLTDKTLNTGFAQMIGTPLYMSPEQAQMSDHDVDTRTDVYSLGVLLYELLTGTTPFDKDRLRETSYDEMRRIIREEDPPRPSTRFSTLGQAASTVCARQRQSDPRRLSRLLRGELDWMVMRALEKDRNRRYESAGAFAADLQRHLHGEPILASPPSAWYRVRKLAWRHRGKLLMAASGLAALLVSVAAIAAGLGWVASDRAARDEALDAHVQITLDEAKSLLETGEWPEAPASLERAEKLLDAAGRAERPARLVELRRDLAMAQRLEDIYTNPATEVPIVGHDPKEMMFAKVDDRAYADAFAEYGIDVAALSVGEAAERIRASSIRQDLARALDQWSGLRRQAGKRRKPDWQHLLEIAKVADPDPWRDRLRTALQSDDRKTLEALAASADVRQLPAGTLALLGRTLAGYLGSPDQAVALLQQAQRQYPRDLWINIMLGWYCGTAVSPHRYEDAARYFGVAVSLRPHSPFLRNCLGRALLWKKAYQEGLAEFSRAIELQPQYAAPWFNRGVALAHLKEWDSALASCREAIRLDPQHAGARYSLAVVLEMRGSFAESEKAFREALRLKPDYAGYHYKLGELLARQQSYSEAESAYREAVRLHPDNSGYQSSLGLALSRQHKFPEAELAYREAIRIKPNFRAYANLGAALQQQYKHGEAEMAYRQSIRLKPDYIWAIDHLGWLLATCADPKVRKPQEARDLGERAVAFNPKVGHYWNMLAAARYRSGDFKGAIAAGEKAMTLNRGGDSNEWFFLAMSHARLGYREKAKGYYERAVKWMDERQPDNEELHRFRAEASEVVGVGSKK